MLTHFLDLLAAVISVTSLLIVTYGALIGIISFLKNEIRRFTGGYSITNIRKLRATFGTYLLLGLEFLIASDILKTVLEPTLNELALLGGIVVLRTILSVFLSDLLEQSKSSSHLIVTQTLFSLHDATFNSKFQIWCESEFIYLHFLRKFIGMIIEPYDHLISLRNKISFSP